MKITRFRFSLEPTPEGWRLAVAQSDTGWARTRLLRKVNAPGGRAFPLPPAADLPAAGSLHADLCAGDRPDLLVAAYQAICNRNPGRDGVKRFGSYLFATLVGDALWTEIKAAAAGSDLVEFALAWPPADQDWQRLNWEMMHGPDGFLAAGQPLRVAITRVVSGTPNPARPLGLPPRLLFVVGSALTDMKIRAGAEYLGFLRQVESDQRRRRIHTRVVLQATRRKLLECCREFAADVVHVICHGLVRPDGRTCLEFQLDEGETDESLRLVTPEQLIAVMAGDLAGGGQGGPLPAIVVLSACGSGAVSGPADAAPFACDLIRGGIPVVVGMAGRVADQACRVFARVFGESLVLGKPLVAAVERGRRAAFAFGPSVHEAVDWAFPVLYVSEAVAPDYAPTPPDDSPAECQLADIIERMRVVRKPVFSARFECLDADFPKAIRGTPPVLALAGETGYGKTRLLLEMAAQSVREGHVPVVVCDDGPGWTPPTTLDRVRQEFAKALRVTRKAFGVKPPATSQLLALDPGGPAGGEAALDPEVKELLGPDKRPTPEAIQRALQMDLEELVTQARAACPHVHEAHGRPLLLLDDFHQYPEAMMTSLFGSEGLSSFGLGESRSLLVPVVLAFSLQEAGGAVLKRIIEESRSRTWLRVVQLQPFRSDGEDLLAYGRVLLNPNDQVTLPGLADRAWAFHPHPEDQVRRECEEDMRLFLQRIPDDFRQKMFYFWVKKARDAGYLVEANDDDRLAQLTW